MAEEGLQLFGGDWTERKLDVLDRYLRAYAKALSKTKFNRIYIDAFAGTGYREKKAAAEAVPDIFEDELKELTAPEPQRFLDGSAKIALRVDPPFHRFIFIEYVGAKVRELENLKTEFPARASSIDIRAGDANATIRDLCRTWDQRHMRSVFPVVAPNPPVLRSIGNMPLFQLFFAAANAGRGGQIALKIAEHILKKI